MIQRSARFLAVLFVLALDSHATAVQSQELFAEPIAIEVNDQPLDVELGGNAAPWVHDFDGDGVRDLLVGEEFDGRLRIYRNRGSNVKPKFSGFELFQQGAEQGKVPDKHGFCPQVVDFDQDGLADIISPAWYASVHWFRQSTKGVFEEGRPFVYQNGMPIRVQWTYGAAAVDWNADGKLDLIVGQQESFDNCSILLLTNEGTNHAPQFSQPTPVLSDGKLIRIPDGQPTPTIADWDADGRLDLIVGVGNGSVGWFRNIGTNQTPKLSAAAGLVAAPKADETRGISAKVCVVDWNLDGKLDLLVGDRGKQFDKQLDQVETLAMEQARQRHESELANWGRVFRSFSTLAKQGESSKLDAERRELINANNRQKKLLGELQAYQVKKQYHGRIWLFVRR